MLYAAVIISLVALAALFLAVRFASSLRRSSLEVEKLKGQLEKTPQHNLATSALKHLSRQHELILETTIEGIIGLNTEGHITFMNAAAEKMLEHGGGIMGQSIQMIMQEPNNAVEFDQTALPVFSALADGVGHHVKDELFWRKDGSAFPVEYVCVPIKEQGEVVGAVLTFEDIAERKDLEEAITQARESALESARLKSEFLANVSHEIRTPMNGIIGMTNILLDSDLTLSQRQTAQTIRSSANSLLAIINDTLDLSRIESGKLRFEPRGFSLRNLVESVIEFFAESARAKSIALDSLFDDEISDIFFGDDGRLRQILINLIGNAIKFTDEGCVILRVIKEDETESQTTLRFKVQDTGAGISETEQQRLFQPFSQVNSKLARKHGGTGLGLAISKQIVELMGGQIGVVSERGEGSTFWFTVKLEKGLKENAIAPQQKAVAITENVVSNIPVFPHEDLSHLKVLVAEDNPVNQQVTLYYLKKLNINADVVINGLEVLSALSRSSYDVVLMDCMMPEMDGYETTRLIREGADSKRIKIIAMTANAMQGERERCIEAGMDDYLSKPIAEEELNAMLARCSSQAESNAPDALKEVIDRKVLDNLYSLEQNGSTHIASEILDTYISHAFNCLQGLKAALENNDAVATINAAHSLKGSSSTLGMKNMAEFCDKLEAKGKSNDLTNARELLNQAEEEFEKIKQAIKTKSAHY